MLIKTTLTNSHVATVAKANGFAIVVLTIWADYFDGPVFIKAEGERDSNSSMRSRKVTRKEPNAA
jgi:hypothetical protein